MNADFRAEMISRLSQLQKSYMPILCIETLFNPYNYTQRTVFCMDDCYWCTMLWTQDNLKWRHGSKMVQKNKNSLDEKERERRENKLVSKLVDHFKLKQNELCNVCLL